MYTFFFCYFLKYTILLVNLKYKLLCKLLFKNFNWLNLSFNNLLYLTSYVYSLILTCNYRPYTIPVEFEYFM